VRLIGAALVAGVLLAGAGAWWLGWRDTATPAGLPSGPGAYEYRTAGFEEVDALGGARHDYPETTAVIVAETECGVTLTWRPLEERAVTWELCRSERGWELRGVTELHRFFGRVDRRAYRCRPGSLLVRATCTAGDVTETATGTLVGREGEVEHVRIRTRLTGGTQGTGTRELWIRSDGVPVRWIVTNESTTPSFLGDVRYRERFELVLVSPERLN
jgi:hypothetical protein